ncbi:MAG: histidinol dehydrogenase, partial [Methanobacterium sp.]|uniref:histidinol dehydrogenase n=1 Tax=Methanobacterium sp. TaxID=2164 RepID=UPI003D64ACE8|nr:histidinol dehydrogenase [Methanobacterium sp.]
IVHNVRENGDDSLKNYTKKFDNVKLDHLKVSADEIKSSYDKVESEVLNALKKAAKNIEKFHKAQMPEEWYEEVDKGVMAGQIIRAIEIVGCYIPGGRAVYPSSVLMTIIPAKIAGVNKIICCTPPMSDGSVNDMVLVAADIAGADEIYKVGGAQAIAAMAYGTESVPKTDKIVGPGNIFVTAAKKLVYGDVDIDFPAGPSEVLIIADKSANSEFIAYDMLAQAEHDPNAACALITTSIDIANEVNEKILGKIKYMKRSKIIEESLEKYGKIIITDSLKDAVDFANEYAPEHLIIMTENPEEILKDIKNAGSIFLGELTPVAAGDYGSGTNHVLPTSKCARMYSGLSTESFIKKPTVQRLSKEGVENLKDVVITLAEYEGLYAHAESFKKRISKN